MAFAGVLLAVLSGLCNGLFTAPMKLATAWKWENIWLVFILVACAIMPAAMVFALAPGSASVLGAAPRAAVTAALAFGFIWGFGAICFGRSVDRLGVSIANSLVIGLSSALGAFVPLLMKGAWRIGPKELVLMGGVAAFILGVALCGKAGRIRDGSGPASGGPSVAGYVFAVVSGVLSAIFNIGYTLALPIADAGVRMGYSQFASTNCIWLLMLGAGAVPNVVYCSSLAKKHGTGKLFFGTPSARPWLLSCAMGLLWGGSIFLYGAATPRLGELGPSVGWPLSLAVGLLVANLMGVWLGEWRGVPGRAIASMRLGIGAILFAIVLCAISARMGAL